jgi:zinc protease
VFPPSSNRGRASLAVLAVLAVGCGLRNTLPEKMVLADYALPQRDFQLGSGLRVLVQEDHNTPLVVVTSVFASGSTSDPAGREGLAHLVEHLAFRSFPGGGQRPMWDLLKRTGATFNAATDWGMTSYYAIAHKDRLADLMQLEAWRLAHTLDGVTAETFAVEREVVRNELRQRSETTIGNRAFDELTQRLYPKDHPLSRPVAGTHESLSALTLDDARAFVMRHYRPANCTIVIAGDVDRGAVAKLLGQWPAETLFAPGGPSAPKVPHPLPIEHPAPPPPQPVSTALAHVTGPVAEPVLMIGWSMPAGMRGQDAILRFAANGLQGSIELALRHELDDAILSSNADASLSTDGSVIVVETHLRRGADIERERKRILDAIGDANVFVNLAIMRSGPWQVATGLLRASTDPVRSGLALAEYLAATGQTAYYSRNLEEVSKLQHQVHAVAELGYRYLRRDRAVSVVFEPESDAPGASHGSTTGAPGGHDLGRNDDVNLTGLGASDVVRVAHSPGLAALPRFQLANGLEVVSVRRQGLPLAEITMQLPGGNATALPFGLASLATELSRPCSGHYGSLSWVGGASSESDGDLVSTLTTRAMAGNVENVLGAMADSVTCRDVRDLPFLTLDRSLDHLEQRQRETAGQPQIRARRALWSALYPGHPYGRFEPDVQGLRRIGHSEADDYVQAHFRPDHATAVVVADLTIDRLRPMMEKFYGEWTSGAASHRPPSAPAASPARAIELFDRPGASQSSVVLGCRIGPVVADALPTYDVLAAVLNERAWKIREAWGATYGLNAHVTDYPGGAAHLLIQGAVETAQTGVAVKALLDLIDEMANRGPDFKTFTLMRWDLASAFDQRFATTDGIARAVLRARLNRWTDEVWDRYPERLANLSRADVRAAAAPCAGHEVITVVGDAAPIRAQLQTIGLAFVAP